MKEKINSKVKLLTITQASHLVDNAVNLREVSQNSQKNQTNFVEKTN